MLAPLIIDLLLVCMTLMLMGWTWDQVRGEDQARPLPTGPSWYTRASGSMMAARTDASHSRPLAAPGGYATSFAEWSRGPDAR
jgi:hypothetical protein